MAYEFNQRLTRTGDSYLLSDSDLRGGYRTVETISQRDNIPLPARTIGMTVFVRSTGKEYWLLSNIGNAAWQIKESANSTYTELLHYFGDVRTYNESEFEELPIAALVEYVNQGPGVPGTRAYFRIKLWQIENPSEAIEHDPNGGEYVGEVTVTFTGNPLTIVQDFDFFLISKYLVPQPDTVSSQITKYSERRAADG